MEGFRDCDPPIGRKDSGSPRLEDGVAHFVSQSLAIAEHDYVRILIWEPMHKDLDPGVTAAVAISAVGIVEDAVSAVIAVTGVGMPGEGNGLNRPQQGAVGVAS
jgi:hypothetical protein